VSLEVVLDGVPLPGDEARAFWRRFSEWMDERAGDLAGFAKAEGLASVRPELHDGSPVLIASRTAAQVPYAPAAKKNARPDGGSKAGKAGSKPSKSGGAGRNESSRKPAGGKNEGKSGRR
jgi:hypothetical protein